jgi:hypothetical protein
LEKVVVVVEQVLDMVEIVEVVVEEVLDMV